MKKTLYLAFFCFQMIFVSCSDETDGLFMSQLRGRAFSNVEEELLIEIKGNILELFNKKEDNCWETDIPPYYMIENYEFSTTFENAVNKSILVVYKSENGVIIGYYRQDVEAERTFNYCTN